MLLVSDYGVKRSQSRWVGGPAVMWPASHTDGRVRQDGEHTAAVVKECRTQALLPHVFPFERMQRKGELCSVLAQTNAPGCTVSAYVNYIFPSPTKAYQLRPSANENESRPEYTVCEGIIENSSLWQTKGMPFIFCALRKRPFFIMKARLGGGVVCYYIEGRVKLLKLLFCYLCCCLYRCFSFNFSPVEPWK